jgi:hypothetical protein
VPFVPVPLLLVPLAPVPVPQCLQRRGEQRLDLGWLRQVRGLELGAQPVHVGQDLAAQLPPIGLSGRVGGEQVGELILLPLGLLEVILKCLGNRFGRERGVLGRDRVGLEQLAVGPHRGG